MTGEQRMFCENSPFCNESIPDQLITDFQILSDSVQVYKREVKYKNLKKKILQILIHTNF